MRVGVSGFVPARLTQARILASLTRVELSERVGKSSSSISRWENGDSAPEAEALSALSMTLGFPLAWFTRPIVEKPVSPIFFRTLASTTKDLRGRAGTKMDWMQEITAYLSTWLEWPELSLPEVHITDHRALDDTEIAGIAMRCREMWGLGLAPITDLSMAAEGAGIVCARVSQGNTKMDGLSQWDEAQNRPFILLSNDKNNYFRGRFDLAHEMGHVILHKNIKTFDILHLKEIERQANYFASCLLLPEELLSVELSRYPSLENILSLKRRWLVSVAAIIYRSEKLGLIGEQEALRLRKSYSARGWVKGEPFDDEVAVESVRLLPRAVNTLLDAKVKTKSALVRDLMMPRKDIEQICGLADGFLIEQLTVLPNPLPKLRGTEGSARSNIFEFNKKSG